MSAKEALYDLRKTHGLTQDDMAEKVCVTRQAVSRWENGETIPNVDTLKTISKEFNVTIDSILGQSQERVCQSCAMPLTKLEEHGTSEDGDLSTEYCSHCYSDGEFTNERTMDEMIETNLRFLSEWNKVQSTNYSEDEAREILKVHLATLKRWKDK